MLPFFFFNDTATTEIYTLSLHDALPISHPIQKCRQTTPRLCGRSLRCNRGSDRSRSDARSEEHTSELQSPDHLVCRLLLEKKKNITHKIQTLTIESTTPTAIHCSQRTTH